MNDVVVLVDAGYLFAQGSKSLSGNPVARSRLSLDVEGIIASLTKMTDAKSSGCRLLRIYWYDGTSSGRLSLDQERLANADNIKLRLGQINSEGQQKGVDSLIVTDLIELARNRAISDALLLAGDEDLRIGVQIAQSYGVRIHLLGIEGNRNSQSRQLYQEADTTTQLKKSEIEQFLSIKKANAQPTTIDTAEKDSVDLKQAAKEFVAELDDQRLREFAQFRKTNNSIPSDLDGRLLALSREKIGRDLDNAEKRSLRATFVDMMKARNPNLFTH